MRGKSLSGKLRDHLAHSSEKKRHCMTVFYFHSLAISVRCVFSIVLYHLQWIKCLNISCSGVVILTHFHAGPHLIVSEQFTLDCPHYQHQLSRVQNSSQKMHRLIHKDFFKQMRKWENIQNSLSGAYTAILMKEEFLLFCFSLCAGERA